ncbi:MAG: rhomboid family intramembrane serine protease [Planctomycetaceae bacterium]|nr:rhomboid family intramembrane serine protease [Planctomycetaceae bacterium]
MRFIGDLEDSRQAKNFSAYLLVKGIETQVDELEEGKRCEIWVKDEDQCDTALADFKAFQLNPSDSKYSEAVQQAQVLMRAEEKKRQQAQKRMVKVSGGVLPKRKPLTIGIIVVCALVGLLTSFGDGLGNGERARVKYDDPVYRALQFVCLSEAGLEKELESWSGSNPNDDISLRLASIRRGQIWRLFTNVFIHYGIFHLIFNMVWFFQFGTLIENRYGTSKFLALLLATAIFSSLLQGIVPGSVGGSVPFLTAGGYWISAFGGMSGVVYGLFGFIWMKSTYDPNFGYRLSQSTIIILMGWMFFCMLPVEMRAGIGFGSNVANWAHGVGLIVGLISGYATSVIRR